ncbi:hypothetical protein Thiowin_00298 [Thiorhodovibrio winogradskyi]|uniref:DUF4268 domain-containing protein n=1 Tax=Thiorhodovibrio winogradskyi TaxID=77007 RepID=A0ABZ0S4W5_9GAMM|nr:hypothetical protein [Thiorhodovibrio winogradskyi]
MRTWFIKQDHPNGGVLSFIGNPAFEADWMLCADPPTEDTQPLNSHVNEESCWFRTDEDDDHLIVQLFNLRWQNTPPRPEYARKLLAKAVNEINENIGERF